MRAVLALLLGAGVAMGQESAKPKSTVMYVAEQQVVPAGKRATLELRFKMLDGYHVNSHAPKSDYLLPTVLETKALEGVTVSAPVYSPGQAFSFSFSPEEKLDVYSGEFTVTLPVVAERGEHLVEATLRYQACDKAACYPPKTLPVQVLFTAK